MTFDVICRAFWKSQLANWMLYFDNPSLTLWIAKKQCKTFNVSLIVSSYHWLLQGPSKFLSLPFETYYGSLMWKSIAHSSEKWYLTFASSHFDPMLSRLRSPKKTHLCPKLFRPMIDAPGAQEMLHQIVCDKHGNQHWFQKQINSLYLTCQSSHIVCAHKSHKSSIIWVDTDWDWCKCNVVFAW